MKERMMKAKPTKFKTKACSSVFWKFLISIKAKVLGKQLKYLANLSIHSFILSGPGLLEEVPTM